jgi:C4-dicarboxylate-specific signal transduction histidine kinase
MGEMASTLAHELNQPLSAIASYNTGCLNKLRSGQYRAEELALALEKVGAQAQRAGKIIRSVRDFVKRSEPQRTECSLNEVVQEALSFLELEARRKSVDMVLQLDGTLPPVHADRVMLEQVILNLAKNGIEAMESSSTPERRLLVRTQRLADNQAQVSVRDRGLGLQGKTQEDLFAPFYSTKAEGMGMGLSICRTIVESHQGRLWVEEAPDGGCLFCFTLPLCPGAGA